MYLYMFYISDSSLTNGHWRCDSFVKPFNALLISSRKNMSSYLFLPIAFYRSFLTYPVSLLLCLITSCFSLACGSSLQQPSVETESATSRACRYQHGNTPALQKQSTVKTSSPASRPFQTPTTLGTRIPIPPTTPPTPLSSPRQHSNTKAASLASPAILRPSRNPGPRQLWKIGMRSWRSTNGPSPQLHRCPHRAS